MHQALQNLEQAINSGNVGAAAMADSALLDRLDAFQTMLQKQDGDPADILQMVRWQKELYSNKTQLQKLPAAQHVVKESREFIDNYGKHKEVGHAYHELMENLMQSFHQTGEALETLNVNVEPEVRRINESLGSTSHLEKAHHDYLVKLQGL